MKKLTVVLAITCLILGGILFIKSGKPPKVITNTEIVYREKSEPITKASIEKSPTVVFLGEKEVISGNTRFVFTETKEDSTSVPINRYDAVVETDSSRADLQIFTDGKLYDVQGKITYNQKETITEITRFKNASGLFLTTEASILPQFERFALGLDYQFKNKILLGVNTSYDNRLPTDQFTVSARVGIRIW